MSSQLHHRSVFLVADAVKTGEKSIPEQMQIVLGKWSPESANCLFQYYFYNHVQPEHVPYYGPAPDEDEKKWEEALSRKPSEGSIPVLAKGFSALAQRLRTQVQAVNALQVRLHEINTSLTAMMQNHDLVISVRAADAKRRHTVLGQRCLSLASKVQVLRNRGYVMDSAEEELKKKLTQLERGVFDPGFSGRAEEIWARMMGVRERARLIREEYERVGSGSANGQDNGIDEEILKKTKQVRRAVWSTIACGIADWKADTAGLRLTARAPQKGVGSDPERLCRLAGGHGCERREVKSVVHALSPHSDGRLAYESGVSGWSSGVTISCISLLKRPTRWV